MVRKKKVKSSRKSKRKALPRVSLLARLWITIRRVIRKPIFIAAFVCAALVTWFFTAEIDHKLQQLVTQQNQKLAKTLGLVLERIYLEGRVHADILNIEDSLGIHKGDPLLSLDLEKIKANLEANPWVRFAVVERALPSTLTIRVIERKPSALWQHQEELRLIDENGEVIEEDSLAEFANLIILVGEDVPLHGGPFLSMLDQYPNLLPHVSSAVRISQRRWDVQLHNGTQIKLPEDDPERAWKYLSEQFETEAYFDTSINVIDLRLEDKVFVR